MVSFPCALMHPSNRLTRLGGAELTVHSSRVVAAINTPTTVVYVNRDVRSLGDEPIGPNALGCSSALHVLKSAALHARASTEASDESRSQPNGSAGEFVVVIAAGPLGRFIADGCGRASEIGESRFPANSVIR